jgi:hypothetical protein
MFGNEVSVGGLIGTSKPGAFCRPAVGLHPEDVTLQDWAITCDVNRAALRPVRVSVQNVGHRWEHQGSDPGSGTPVEGTCSASHATRGRQPGVEPEALRGGWSPHFIHPPASHKARNRRSRYRAFARPSPCTRGVQNLAASNRIAICETQVFAFA